MIYDFDNLMVESRRPALNGPRVEVDELLYDPNLLAYRYQGDLFTGIAYETWPDGRLCFEGEFVDGLRCGLARHWFANGQLEEEGFSWNDGVHGPCRAFDTDGRLRDWGWSEYGIPLETKLWSENGKLVEHHTLAEDDPLWSVWYSEHARFLAGESDFPALPARPQPPILPNETDSSTS